MGFKAADRGRGRARGRRAGAHTTRGASLAALTERVAELEEYARELNWKILIMATSKLSHPRYPYWNWMLESGLFDERRTWLEVAMSRLDDRLAGEETPALLRKDIPGVPRELLEAKGPPTADEVFAVIRAITGHELRKRHVEVVRAMLGQGMFRNLCQHVLDEIDPDRRQPGE